MPPKKKQDAPEVKPENVKPDEAQAPTDPPAALDSPAPENAPDTDATAPDAGPDASPDAGDTAGQEGNPDSEGQAPGADAELVEVDEPCRKCYPDGWPAPEHGASASCFHGLAVVFGQANYAPRDIAHACDLV